MLSTIKYIINYFKTSKTIKEPLTPTEEESKCNYVKIKVFK